MFRFYVARSCAGGAIQCAVTRTAVFRTCAPLAVFAPLAVAHARTCASHQPPTNATSASTTTAAPTSTTAATTSSRSIGVVTRWVNDKGFGFVSLQGKSLFVHAREISVGRRDNSNVKGGGGRQAQPRLHEGQQVEFTVGAQPDGRLRAVNITDIGGGPLPTGPPRHASSSGATSSSSSFSSGDSSARADGGGEDDFAGSFNSAAASSAAAAAASAAAAMRAAAAGANAKLFTPHQWNCVESGNAAVDGLKATSFPMDAGGEHDLPVPTEKWAGDVDRAPAGVDAKQQQQQQPRASTSSDRGSDNDAHPHQGDTHAHTHSHATGHGYGAAPAPSSSSRPIWESELLGWPSEFAAREMDFFDLEELEERRSGWLEGMEK